MKRKKNIPYKTILLFLAVTIAIVVSFILWESDIRELMEKGIRYADSNLLFVALILYLTLACNCLQNSLGQVDRYRRKVYYLK